MFTAIFSLTKGHYSCILYNILMYEKLDEALESADLLGQGILRSQVVSLPCKSVIHPEDSSL